MTNEKKQRLDERSPELKSDLEAQPDDLGKDPSQVGTRSAGQTASAFGLSHQAEADEDSVEDLSDKLLRLLRWKASKMLLIIPSARLTLTKNTAALMTCHREIGTTKLPEPSHQSVAMKSVQRQAGPFCFAGFGQAASREAECA